MIIIIKCYLCFTRILVTFVRTLSSKRVHKFFVWTLVILLERYLVLHIICIRTLHNHSVQLLFEEGRCHGCGVLLIDSTVLVHCEHLRTN